MGRLGVGLAVLGAAAIVVGTLVLTFPPSRCPEPRPAAPSVPRPPAAAALRAAARAGKPLLAIVRPEPGDPASEQGDAWTALVRLGLALEALAFVHPVVLSAAEIETLAPGATAAPSPLAVVVPSDGGGGPARRVPRVRDLPGAPYEVTVTLDGTPPEDPWATPLAVKLRAAVGVSGGDLAARAAQVRAASDPPLVEAAVRSARALIRLQPEVLLALAPVLLEAVTGERAALAILRESLRSAVGARWERFPPDGLAWRLERDPADFVDLDGEVPEEPVLDTAGPPSPEWCGTGLVGEHDDLVDARVLRFEVRRP